MYYKVIKNNKVIDVLNHLKYFKWQTDNEIMVLTDIINAQAILSSDETIFWHIEHLYELPDNAPKLDTVELVEIDKYEYDQLRILNLKSPEEIIDAFVASLLEDNLL